MYTSSGQKHIAFAVLAAAVLIAAALFIREHNTQPRTNTQNVAVVQTSPKRKPMKTLDENDNGIPDWQEALINTDPVSVSPTSTAYEAPDTLTEQFSLEFFQDMVRAKNYGVFGGSADKLAQKASTKLIQKAQDTLLTTKDIHIAQNNSISALDQYGEAIARIINSYQEDSESTEAEILEDALRNHDAEAIKKLDAKVTYYKNILRDTQALYVPSTLTREHLNLLNSYQAIANDIEAMREAFNDPMLALLRVKRYQDDVQGMNQAIIDVYTSLFDKGASWDNNSVVFSLIGVDTDI